MADRLEAERRVNQIRAFRSELEALTRAGASPLSAEQEGTIARYHDDVLERLYAAYDVDRSERAGQLSRGMQLLSFFGAVALTAAVYSLVSRFWGRIDPPLQATLLAMFPLVSLVGLELAARRERTLYVASLFALVAYGTFWLAIGTLSWMFNIPITTTFVWAGAFFGVALALPYGFRVILAVALLALALAVAGSMFAAAGSEWTQALAKPEIITFAGFSMLLLAPRLGQVERGFAPVTRLVAIGIGLLGLLMVSTVGEMSVLPVSSNAAEAVYQGVMLVTCVACLAIGIRRGWIETVNLAAVMLAIFLFVRFVDWFWDLLPRYVFFLILAAAAFAALLVLRRLRGRLRR